MDISILRRVVLIAIGVLIVAALLGGAYAWYELQVASQTATDLAGSSGAATSSTTGETNQQIVEKSLQNGAAPIAPSSGVPAPTVEQSKAAVQQSLNTPPPATSPAASQKTQEANQQAVEAALNGGN